MTGEVVILLITSGPCIGINKRVADRITERLIGHFPTTAAAFEISVTSLLLGQLSRYFWDLQYPSANLSNHHRSVQLTQPVLKALSTLTFRAEVQSPVTDDNGDDFDGMFIVKKSKQKDRKKAKRAPRRKSLDSKLFDQLGVEVPRSQDEVEFLERELLDEMKGILIVRDMTPRCPLSLIYSAAIPRGPTQAGVDRYVHESIY